MTLRLATAEYPSAPLPRRKPQSARGHAALPVGHSLLLYSRVQAAAMLNISASTLDQLRKQHPLLKPVRIGDRPLWPLQNLMAFVAELTDAGDEDGCWDHPSA